MARSNYRGGTSRRAPKDTSRRVKKKPCALCRDHVEWVDYKDVPLLRKFMSDRGKIRSRRVTGNCAQHQRDIAEAIKTARELVLLPYTQRTVTERPGGRSARGERGERGDRGAGGERGDRGPGGRDHDRPGRGDGRGAAAGAAPPAGAGAPAGDGGGATGAAAGVPGGTAAAATGVGEAAETRDAGGAAR